MLHRILRLPDGQFKIFTQYLDQQYGDVLRMTSEAVGNIVRAIFNEEVDSSEVFGIESCLQAQIIQYPRGCQALINLLSTNSATGEL